MNLIVVSGNLIREGQVVRSSGADVYKNCIAVNRDITIKGENNADFIEIVGYGNVGKYLQSYGKKGSFVLLQGSLYTSQFIDKSGIKRKGFNIVVSKAKIINNKTKGK